MFKWEFYCCDTVKVEASAHPPTHIREVTLFVYAENEGDAYSAANELVDREHYQAIECVEEIPEGSYPAGDEAAGD